MAPTATSEVDSQAKYFPLILETKCDGNISLKKYKSTRTGITFVLADVKGPLVNGYLCLATEAHEDDGLPHTLEHLVFLGSESYPYKGILDLLANRCLASGTNAWTAGDHTCYTMTTAGSEGFMNLLPIYLDHVLYPTLTDSGFTTEVYHINGEGEDSGTVYCEMQGRENTGEQLCKAASLAAIYPGHCGYKSEVGGKMKNLRESTTNEKVRDYHKAFYRPDNLCVVITGQVDAEDVFRAVQPIEEKILSKGQLSKFTRPWQSPVPPLEASLDQTVPYPCDDDTYGMVMVAWRGPKVDNIDDTLAMKTLVVYLIDTSVAPLQKELVEVDDPLCGQIGFGCLEYAESYVQLEFQTVPKEKLHLIKPKMIEVFKKLVESEDNLNMKRMAAIIHSMKLDVLSNMESDAHSKVSTSVITDFLYGHSNEDLVRRMQLLPILDKLKELKAKFWIDLIKTYLIDAVMITTVGEGSPSLMKETTESEKERIATRRSSLGEEGLKNKQEELQKSIANNEIAAPQTVLTSVPVPGVQSIHFHSIKRSCSYFPETIDAINEFPLKNLPCHFELDDLESAFVKVSALLDTSLLSTELRLYLPLWAELILVSPVLRDGKMIPHEDVITELSEHTIIKSCGIGVTGGKFSCGNPALLALVLVKVEPERYEKGASLLKEVLYDSQFVAERISVVAKKMIKDVDETKRDGSIMSYLLMNNMSHSKKSNKWAVSAIRQEQFLTEVLKKLESNPQEVISKLEELRKSLKDLTIHMCADVKALTEKKDPHAPWIKNFVKEGEKLQPKSEVEPDHLQIQPLDCGIPTGVIVGLGAVESAFLVQTAQMNISYMHPDLPALKVLIQYLTQLEGPLWRQIRGQGLSYNYAIALQIPEQQIYFSLYKASNVTKAYQVAKTIVENHISGVEPWEQTLLEASRSSVMYETIGKEKSISDVYSESIFAYLRKVEMDYNRKILEPISKVQLEDLKRVASLYLTPLFDTSKTRCAICCHPSKVEELISEFKAMSRDLTEVKSLEDSFLGKFDF